MPLSSLDTSDIDVCLRLDVGKGEHHATALTPAGKKAFDKRLPNTEPKSARSSPSCRPSTAPYSSWWTGRPRLALPLAVARDAGLQGRLSARPDDASDRRPLPGRKPRPARDAFIIAAAARAMPHTLRTIDVEDETIAELEMIVGFDDDLAGEATRISNRLRGLLTQIHPSLESVLGPRVQHPALLLMLERFGSRAQLTEAGRRRLVKLIRAEAPRMAERLVDDVFTALDGQTVVIPGTDSAALIVPSLSGRLKTVPDQRKLLATRIEELLEAHPLSKVLISMPGVGVRTGARILIDVDDGGDSDGSTFPTAGHLASYAGLAPATRSSGSSIRGEQPSRRGNKKLKRAFFLSAFAALADPASSAYYDKKIAQANTTPRPSSASHDAEPTCSSRCSAPAPSTNHSQSATDRVPSGCHRNEVAGPAPRAARTSSKRRSCDVPAAISLNAQAVVLKPSK
ncbi:transposase [Streptomyces sp. NPDC050516]|uniref:IS110 family transposase n=1 Tax=Streptomyces sp. NPDC050516 TaxID=3365621 RepID=UPI003798C34A